MLLYLNLVFISSCDPGLSYLDVMSLACDVSRDITGNFVEQAADAFPVDRACHQHCPRLTRTQAPVEGLCLCNSALFSFFFCRREINRSVAFI